MKKTVVGVLVGPLVLGLLAATQAQAADKCAKDKKFMKVCQELTAARERNMCNPSQIGIRNPETATAWLQARADAAALEARFQAVVKDFPKCYNREDATNCAIWEQNVRECSDLPKKYEEAWKGKIKSAQDEVDRFLPDFEKKVGTAPKEAYKSWPDVKRYLSKEMGTVLWVEPDNAQFLALEARLRELKKKMTAANMDEIKSVQCPKAGKPNPGLAKTLMKVYEAWLSGLSRPVKALKLLMAEKVHQETDWQGTKWEYGYVTTCIEDKSDMEDPARCSVQELSFKRSKPVGKGWSGWSFNGHGARDDAMLCKNVK